MSLGGPAGCKESEGVQKAGICPDLSRDVFAWGVLQLNSHEGCSLSYI